MDAKLSCGVVVARNTDDGWKTVLLRAFHHWDFPKGIREPGEDPMQAALREVLEETGIDDLSFEWGDRFFETGPYQADVVSYLRHHAAGRKPFGHGKRLGCYF